MEQFYKLARQIHEERVSDWKAQTRAREYSGENIYTRFSLWCDAYKNGKEKNNPNTFAQFLKIEGITLTFRQRKWIAQKYFGFNFNYNYDKQKWEITKNV